MSNPRLELDLLRSELDTLYQVSKVLSRSLNFKETLDGVLHALHEGVALERGMVSLIDAASGELQVSLVYGVSDTVTEEVSYLPGEGVVGTILKTGNSIVVECIMDEPRFLSRMGIYNPQGAFVGVPIRIGQKVVGVLAAQPAPSINKQLDEYQHFLEMVANLIGQSVRLSQEVAQEKKEIAEERDVLRRTVRGQYGFDNIIGHTQPMRRIFEQVRLVAKWNTTVLIRGETGTGKELIANAIHYNSPRARGSFVKLNCAALPETLLETELFGHEKGAFTGAVAQRKGRFEQAEGGTVFLDEIGEISASFQAKLLRVLQEGELERVGGTGRSRSMCAWSPRRTATWKPKWKKAASAKTCITASTSCRCTCRRCASAWKTSRRSRASWWRKSAPTRPPAQPHRCRAAHAHAPRLAGQRARTGELPGARLGDDRRQHHRPRCHPAHRHRREDLGQPRRHPGTGSRRPQSRRTRESHRRAGTGRLGTGQGRAPARHDAEADRLSHPDAEYQGAADMSIRYFITDFGVN